MKSSIGIHGLAFAILLFTTGCNNGEEDKLPSTPPILSTVEQSNVTTTTAISGGKITSTGSAPVTAYGVCWATNPSPTTADNKSLDGSGPGEFVSQINSLVPNTTYFVKAYATNAAGTAYGNEISFTTYAAMDIEDNGYYSSTIGTQVWLNENLKVTRYRNGDAIPNVVDNTQWSNLTSGAYCFLRNDPNVKDDLGILYNWYAIEDDRKLCPSGWHVPSDSEWETLVSHLGGTNVAGGKMKETGTLHWFSPNVAADNSSGFSGLSGGQRGVEGEFFGPGSFGCFWTSTEESETNARDWFLYSGDATVIRYYDKKIDGFNVRCVKD